jgi:uncharacterized YigZ family protein
VSQYFTIVDRQEGLYKDRGSKFLSFAIPISSEEDVKSNLAQFKKDFYDARHHCYAYNIGLLNQKWRSNDDGEPAHSAGDPILGQIRSFGLTNVMVIVVRYFGGTKLGVGGLINAYKTAAAEALSLAVKKEIFEEANVLFHFPYDILSVVERLIHEMDITVIDRDYQQDCRINARIRIEMMDELKKKTSDLYNLQLSITQ